MQVRVRYGTFVLYLSMQAAATANKGEPLRIGMFCDMYTPYLSGVTNYIRLYKRRYEELGHEVFVITYGSRDHEDDEPGVIRSPGISWGKTGWQAGAPLSAEAKEIIPGLDIGHLHHPFVAGRVGLAHCRAAGVPVVFTNHTRYDLYSDTYGRFVPRGWRMSALRNYMAKFASEVDLVIAPSPGVQKWLCDFGITCNAVQLSNAVDTQPFMNPSRPCSRSEFGFTDQDIIYVYLGRLSDEKNLGLLMDAFVSAAERDDRVALLLIGDGPSRKMATERAWAHGVGKRVHFAGRTPYEHVPDILASADVFVTASVTEVHPLVIMEGMAAGLPVIGVHSPGVGDIVESGVTGFLTQEKAPEFAERILDYSRDDELRQRMAKAAKAEAAKYDVRIAADVMIEQYELLIENPRV